MINISHEFYHTENCDFFYRVGDVTTKTPWLRPNYSSVRSFLNDFRTRELLDKYKNSYLYGSFIWKDIETWDLDIGLTTSTEKPNWNEVEQDMNILNDLSLNNYNLLLDLSVRMIDYEMPTKQELEYHNRGLNMEDWSYYKSQNSVIKISQYHKKSCEKEMYFDFKNSEYLKGRVQSITDKFLVEIDYSFLEHPKKVIYRIFNSKKEKILSKLDVCEFVKLSDLEFKNIQNF
ncbi:hypothetical protein EBU71_03150 [bacterium]|nr:hypothetical protein [Candidatus Elulimicrobium humile]